MAKKDFSNLDTSRAMQQLQTALAQDEQVKHDNQDKQENPVTQESKGARKPRKRYSAEEAAKILESGRNARGLGGVKMPRINLAFSPVNHDFIVTLARMRGETYTDFVNRLVDLYREQFKDQYEAAKKLRESI